MNTLLDKLAVRVRKILHNEKRKLGFPFQWEGSGSEFVKHVASKNTSQGIKTKSHPRLMKHMEDYAEEKFITILLQYLT